MKDHLEMSEPISGQIAAVIDSKRVVINRGTINGTVKGMIFTIRLDIPKIVDPEDPSNELEGLFYSKGSITITDVHERMAFGTLMGKSRFAGLTGLIAEEILPTVAGGIIGNEGWIIKQGDGVKQVKRNTWSPVDDVNFWEWETVSSSTQTALTKGFLAVEGLDVTEQNQLLLKRRADAAAENADTTDLVKPYVHKTVHSLWRTLRDRLTTTSEEPEPSD